MSVGVYLWVRACQKNLVNISEFCKPFIVVRQIFLGVMMGVLIDLIPFFSGCMRLCVVWIKHAVFTNKEEFIIYQTARSLLR